MVKPMNISSFIDLLNDFRNEYGDLDIYIKQCGCLTGESLNPDDIGTSDQNGKRVFEIFYYGVDL